MKYLLLTANIDWADEFGCEMFGVFTDKQWEKLCEKTKALFKRFENPSENDDEDEFGYSESGEVEACFGTNESLQFGSYKDWVGKFTKKEITKEQYDFLKKTFGQVYGTGSGAFLIASKDELGDIVEMED